MPVPRTMANVTNITYSGSSANDWSIAVKNVAGTVTLGTYYNGVGYTDGAAQTAAAVRIDVAEDLDPIDIADTDTIEISYDSTTIVVYLSQLTESATLYVDTNGVCYTDAALTTMFSFGAITNETIAMAEDETESVGVTQETLVLSEVEEAGTVESTDETIILTEDSAGMFGFTEETITISESYYGWIGGWEFVNNPSGDWTAVNDPG